MIAGLSMKKYIVRYICNHQTFTAVQSFRKLGLTLWEENETFTLLKIEYGKREHGVFIYKLKSNSNFTLINSISI